jgi:NADH:ubiquinone oxidoreductase subunit K
MYTSIVLILILTGILGLFLGRKNLILLIISLELLLLGLVYHYLLIGWGSFGDINSVLFGIFVLVISAAESAIGLALIISYNKYRLN